MVALPQRFRVCWKDTLNAYHTVGDVRVDGRYCGGTLHRATGGAGTTIFKDGIRDSLASRRPFVFAQLEVTGAFPEIPSRRTAL